MQDRSRPNLAMALLVDHGIAMAARAGIGAAAAYLAERNVPDAVIARVLCDPGRRRVTGAVRLAAVAPAHESAVAPEPVQGVARRA